MGASSEPLVLMLLVLFLREDVRERKSLDPVLAADSVDMWEGGGGRDKWTRSVLMGE
jgi:hypothetical protein